MQCNISVSYFNWLAMPVCCKITQPGQLACMGGSQVLFHIHTVKQLCSIDTTSISPSLLAYVELRHLFLPLAGR